MPNLAKKKCAPCEEGGAALSEREQAEFLNELGGEWKVVNEHHLEKEFLFKNFKEALDFTVKLGEIAEQEGHHPDIHLSWGKVRVILWTHKINGLSENDFVLAAKIDEIR